MNIKTILKQYYALLGVKKDCTDEELKKAYRVKCMEHHPDKGGDPEMFNIIKNTYNTLVGYREGMKKIEEIC